MSSSIKPAIYLTVLLILLFISSDSFSQTGRLSISLNSITSNFNYGKSNSRIAPYKKNFSGLQAGFAYEYRLSPVLSMVPELYAAIKGASIKENNPLTINKSTLRVFSVEMPLLLRLHFGNFYLNAGPYAGYNISGRIKTQGSALVPESSDKISFGFDPNEFRRWDFGVFGGAGYNFKIRSTQLTLDIRHGYGLKNLSGNIERYNRSLIISLKVAKPNGKK